MRYHGDGISTNQRSLERFDIVLSTYETVASDSKRSGALQKIMWYRVVLDEGLNHFKNLFPIGLLIYLVFLKAHHIRNRPRSFEVFMNLRAGRRWCLTGTPVQNRLDDLFAIMEFLRFSPVENRSNARRWILDPLGMNDMKGLDNLRLLMGAAVLRRPMNSENSHRRFDEEVTVSLSPTERQQYHCIRRKAREVATRVDRNTSSHTLLSYILQLRQLCSHGHQQAVSRPEAAVIRTHLTHNPICQKCASVLSEWDQALNSGNVSRLCHECASDDDNDPILISNSESLPRGRSNISKDPESSYNSPATDRYSDEMDIDEIEPPRVEKSSKVESIMRNLRQLERKDIHSSAPVKR